MRSASCIAVPIRVIRALIATVESLTSRHLDDFSNGPLVSVHTCGVSPSGHHPLRCGIEPLRGEAGEDHARAVVGLVKAEDATICDGQF